MPTKVIKDPGLSNLSDQSKPVVVTDGLGCWWVEDPPMGVRLCRCGKKKAAIDLWNSFVEICYQDNPGHQE